jgi:hypothetical protein
MKQQPLGHLFNGNGYVDVDSGDGKSIQIQFVLEMKDRDDRVCKDGEVGANSSSDSWVRLLLLTDLRFQTSESTCHAREYFAGRRLKNSTINLRMVCYDEPRSTRCRDERETLAE